MSWQRFGYVCRKAAVDWRDDERLSDCLSRIEGEGASALYGEPIEPKAWPRHILDSISRIKDRDEAHRTLAIYAGLPLGRIGTVPEKNKGILAYLTLVTFVFFLVLGLYQSLVVPVLLDTLADFMPAPPLYLVFFQQHWEVILLVLSLVVGSVWMLGFETQRLLQFRVGIERRPVVRALLSGRVRRSYLRLIEILGFPLATEKGYSSAIYSHLNGVAQSPMDLSTEMEALIAIQMQTLLEASARQMKGLTTLLALLLVAVVAGFLASAYTPLFILGGTL